MGPLNPVLTSVVWQVLTLGGKPYPALSNQEVMRLVRAGGRLELPPGPPRQVQVGQRVAHLP